jgi:rhamnogalacturonyl hydrolase YesR
MKRYLTSTLVWLGLTLSFSQVLADVSLPRILGSNMVLQRGQPVPVWGWAEPGESVTVQFGAQTKTTKADAAGRWQVRLGSLKASAVPADLVVAGGNRIVLTNVLVGEVWLCSGQSNMEKPIGEQPGQKPVPNYEQELASSDYPQIRLFKVEKEMAATPAKDVNSKGWFLSNSNSHQTLKFSAAAYFFGRRIHQELGVPIGLIESAWGGTRIEPWTAPIGFDSVPALSGMIKLAEPQAKIHNRMPTTLYNGMIAPLVPFAFRGALWYQGESNLIDIHDGPIYAEKMRALIEGWRKTWDMGAFSFYYVQLAPFTYYGDRRVKRADSPERLPEMWEAQTAALKIPKTGMIITTDLVDDPKDIHPRNKQEIGERLARLALAKDYGRKDLAWSGPTFRSAKFSNARAIVRFDHVEEGLKSQDGRPLTWFTVAGEDGKFVSAEAVIEGDKIVASSPEVAEPKALRFAWDELAMPNLVNSDGLPARPFRTDRLAIVPRPKPVYGGAYFTNWPSGTDPAEVGRRIANNFIPLTFRYQTNAAKAHLGVIYPEVCVWYGSLTVAALTRDQQLTEKLVQKFAPYMTEAGAKHINRSAHVDYRVFGVLPLQLYLQTTNRQYLQLGLSLADAQWSNTTPDGITAEARYWIDDMYMIPALQVQAYRATKDMKYLDRAALAVAAYFATMQQTNGLFYHGTNAPFYWSRGNGWMAAGSAELLRDLPPGHPHHKAIMDGYRKLMAGLLATQDENGMWHQLMDVPTAWPETSGSAMFAFAFATGVKQGWLDEKTYGPATRKAWLSLVGYLDESAYLREVCIGTNKGDSEQFYLDRPRATGDLHGQAAMLWAATALLK